MSAALGAELTIRLDIEAFYPDGIPEDVIRIVSESARTLSFEEVWCFNTPSRRLPPVLMMQPAEDRATDEALGPGAP